RLVGKKVRSCQQAQIVGPNRSCGDRAEVDELRKLGLKSRISGQLFLMLTAILAGDDSPALRQHQLSVGVNVVTPGHSDIDDSNLTSHGQRLPCSFFHATNDLRLPYVPAWLTRNMLTPLTQLATVPSGCDRRESGEGCLFDRT